MPHSALIDVKLDTKPGGSSGVPLRVKIGAPQSVIDAAKRRGVVLPPAYSGTEDALARLMGFTIAGATSLEQLQAVKDSLDAALAKGDSFTAWKRSVMRGDVPLSLPAYRLETIFRTNMQSNYMVGRGVSAAANALTHPYLLYTAVNDSRTRPAHAAMNGTILPLDDPWWKTHRPPNGYNCRCSVVQLTKKEAQRRGITTLTPNVNPDPGFDSDPWADPMKGVRTGLDRFAREADPPLAAIANDLAAVAKMPASVATVDEAIERGRAELSALLDQLPASVRDRVGDDAVAMAELRDKLQERIATIHGESVKAEIQSGARSIAGKLVADTSRVYPASWVKATNAFGPLDVQTSTSRAYQVTRANRSGLISTRAGAPNVAIHEFGHRIQHALPELDKLLHDYFERRTLGERLVPMRNFGPYRNDEFTKPDEFLDPYFGKLYAGGPLEMFAMTFEYLLSPGQFAAMMLFSKDRELFELAIGMLTGWMP